MSTELVERLRDFAVHLEPASYLYADEIAALRSAADELTALTADRDAARKVYLTLQQSNAVLASRISTLEQAVDAFADICDELGCERDNEAGLQAAAALTAKVADAEQRVAALMSERSSLIATKAEQLVALTKRATAAEAAVKKEQEAWMDIERANRELFDGAVEDILKIKALTAKVALLTEALRPFSHAAGGVFTRNFNASDVLFLKGATASHAESKITAGDLFAARRALSEPDKEGT